MVKFIMDSGEKESLMAMEHTLGQISPHIRGISKEGLSKEKENIKALKAAYFKGYGKMVNVMVEANYQKIWKYIKECGKMIKQYIFDINFYIFSVINS